jgi:hypothetical protein
VFGGVGARLDRLPDKMIDNPAVHRSIRDARQADDILAPRIPLPRRPGIACSSAWRSPTPRRATWTSKNWPACATRSPASDRRPSGSCLGRQSECLGRTARPAHCPVASVEIELI